MAELDQCVATTTALKNRPPDSTDGGGSGTPPLDANKGSGAGSGSGSAVTTDKSHNKQTGSADNNSGDDDDDKGSITKGATAEQPSVLTVRVLGGAAKVSAGDLTVPMRFTGGLFGGYPLAINQQLTLELGAGLEYQPAAYQNVETNSSQSASFVTVLANVGVLYAVAPKIGIRADVGLGVLAVSGLEMGNPFTMNGAATSGALTMFALRFGLSADYAVTPNVFVTAAPFAFAYSPAKSGFLDSISAITRIDFMVGVGYRM